MKLIEELEDKIKLLEAKLQEKDAIINEYESVMPDSAILRGGIKIQLIDVQGQTNAVAVAVVYQNIIYQTVCVLAES